MSEHPIFYAGRVRRAALEVLRGPGPDGDPTQGWLNYYLRRMERQARQDGADWSVLERLDPPETWRRLDAERLKNATAGPGSGLPVVSVATKGLQQPPKRDGKRVYHGLVVLSVAVGLFTGGSEEDGELASELYIAALRAALTQDPTWDGVIQDIAWVDEDTGVAKTNRSVHVAEALFVVDYGQLMHTVGDRPPVPPPDPPEGTELPDGPPDVRFETVRIHASPKGPPS